MTNATRIEYFGFDPSETSLLKYPKFVEALEEFELVLVNDKNEEVTAETTNGYTSVMDPATGETMYALYDDQTSVELDNDGFEEVLRAMDSYAKSKGWRIFMCEMDDEDGEYDDLDPLVEEGHPAFTAEYNFDEGVYRIQGYDF